MGMGGQQVPRLKNIRRKKNIKEEVFFLIYFPVVSIDLFCSYFCSFSYNGACNRIFLMVTNIKKSRWRLLRTKVRKDQMVINRTSNDRPT